MSATTQVVLDDSSIRVPDKTFINIELCSNAYSEQLNFRNVSHGDLMFRKSIIKHLLKRFGI